MMMKFLRLQTKELYPLRQTMESRKHSGFEWISFMGLGSARHIKMIMLLTLLALDQRDMLGSILEIE